MLPRMFAIRYLALGDSYTIGTGASGPENNFPSLLASRLQDVSGLKVDVTNPAVNGFTSSDLIREELGHLAKVRPDLVSILIGANDVVQGFEPTTYEANLQSIYGAVAATVANADCVLVVTIPNWSVAPAAQRFGEARELANRIQRFNAIAMTTADSYGFTVADVFPISALAHDGWLSDDQLHPSDRQYAVWAQFLWGVVGRSWNHQVATAVMREAQRHERRADPPAGRPPAG